MGIGKRSGYALCGEEMKSIFILVIALLVVVSAAPAHKRHQSHKLKVNSSHQIHGDLDPTSLHSSSTKHSSTKESHVKSHKRNLIAEESGVGADEGGSAAPGKASEDNGDPTGKSSHKHKSKLHLSS